MVALRDEGSWGRNNDHEIWTVGQVRRHKKTDHLPVTPTSVAPPRPRTQKQDMYNKAAAQPLGVPRLRTPTPPRSPSKPDRLLP